MGGLRAQGARHYRHPMRVALYQPEIAGNTGAILRVAACLGAGADIIEPCGFPFSDRALKRAGMDYLEGVDLVRHAGWDAFRATRPGRIVLLSTRGAVRIEQAGFRPSDTLLFGQESAGVPEEVRGQCDLSVRIALNQGMRSLNVATSAAIALFEALRQTGDLPLETA